MITYVGNIVTGPARVAVAAYAKDDTMAKFRAMGRSLRYLGRAACQMEAFAVKLGGGVTPPVFKNGRDQGECAIIEILLREKVVQGGL